VKTTGLTFDDVREIGLTLPNTTTATAWGSPSLEVNGRRFCAIAINKSAEPNSLGLHCDFDTRDAMIAEQPELYYTAPHYENYPCVLVRLSRIRRDVLEDLLRMAHQFESARHPKRARSKRPSRRPRRARRTKTAR
jgi:hypothetical protein